MIDKIQFMRIKDINHEEKDFLIQFFILTTRKIINQILLSITRSDHLSSNDFGYQMIEKSCIGFLRWA